MAAKEIKSADEIIKGCEAEGLKYIGQYSLPQSIPDQMKEDEWEEIARKRNGMLVCVWQNGLCIVFERANVFSGPRTKKAYVRSAA